ncbi:MAG: hypothetical protein K8W52_22335 [Deltaproteobacteria bacterium]|nr:hypothetical protein [Deltaproteobacteria bacterium]
MALGLHFTVGMHPSLRPTIAFLVLTVAAPLVGACGSDGPPPPTCTGTSCACDPGTSCDLGGSTCAGSSCTLDCPMDNSCTGACGESCSVDCGGGSTCELTVGPSSSITCAPDSTCVITCTGSCSMSCGNGATCSLQCNGETAPKPISGGGSCS